MRVLVAFTLFICFNIQAACNFDVVFTTIPETKQQKVEISSDVQLLIAQRIAQKTINGSVVATNVTCQYLKGKSYTNSESEWQAYLDNAIKALGKSGANELEVSIIGSEDKVYRGELSSLEYQFNADFAGNRQVIKNLAVLDIENNSLISFSVSGSQSEESEISDEFERVISSFKLNN
ncbi:hypothetical protein [Pseudoalteromonas sp. JC3]|uniref:hypothetical protein n=1 Tax=Pseudoalteromonas sp. JC3 TaxID=2810196 RepID=UPI0019D03C05|nr:hypothetical protein [Pseudoalteromonas sp. JC3]MBR8842484.1 hypothetical protein [Pseudoalteromonas sp. JC3]WJE09398.1 hypothetical protein QSH61_02700 [Pseudoalteromonas sp. JC3]